MIAETFRADRGREYGELTGCCGAFLTEISKETRAGKFTVAELEESEQDLEKLERWLGKIEARDFFQMSARRSRARWWSAAATMLSRTFQGVYPAPRQQTIATGVWASGHRLIITYYHR